MKEALKFLFPGITKAIEEHRCPVCNEPIGEFRNVISKREYEISGMCQMCQDKVFGKD